LGTPIGNFGDPSAVAFHNWIEGLFVKLKTLLINETLYYITGELDKSTKKLKMCISICHIKVSGPSFKQPKTPVLKSVIFLINYGMKGLSCETMKAFINFLDKYPKHPLISSCV
jgi:hypothetical protein